MTNIDLVLRLTKNYIEASFPKSHCIFYLLTVYIKIIYNWNTFTKNEYSEYYSG